MATVLVIEKETNLRLLMAFELADALHHGVLVADQQELEDVLRFERPDVAVLGLGIHMTDEFQTMYWLKCQYPELPIVLYAAGMDVQSRAFLRMVDAFVVKQSDPEPLLVTIDRLCEKRCSMPT